MYDGISAIELRRLAARTADPCVSVYVRTHRSGPETAADRTRFKNALAVARRDLHALGLRAPAADRLLAPAQALTADDAFWAHLERTLAVFLDDRDLRVHRLAAELAELVVVGRHFHVSPLVPFAEVGVVFYVLVLSQNRVRLIRCGRHDATELSPDGLPSSIDEALRFDDREPQLRTHVGTRVGRGRVAATFHGHGAGADSKTADLTRFLSVVDDEVRQLIGTDLRPLVLAGTSPTVARFRHVSRYTQIAPGELDGGVASSSIDELQRRAWPLVAPIFDEPRHRAAALLDAGAGRIADTLEAVAIAAIDGRIETVFLPAGTRRWGLLDTDQRRVVEHLERLVGDRDLLDAIAAETLVHDGQVFVVDADQIPRGAEVAAALRY